MELTAEKKEKSKSKTGYKQTEIGLIPEDWEVKKLGEIGQCIIGLTYKPDDISSDGILVLRASNIGENTLKYDDNVHVKINVNEKLITTEGDILVCVRNGSRNLIGKCAYIQDRAVNQTFGAFMSIFRSTYNQFIFYVFQSSVIKRQIEENIGATLNQITNKNFNSFVIPFPTDKEKQTIAQALSDTDELVNSLENLITKKKNIKQGAMQELLTGKKRLFGFAKSKKYKQIEIGLIPEDWEVKKLNSICDVRDGTHESPKYFKDGVCFITSKNIVIGKINYTDITYISKKDAENIDKRSKVDKDDILMSMIGTIGNSVLIDFEPDFCIKNVALIKPQKIESTYLIQLLYSQFYQIYLQGNLDGGIQKFISLGALRKLDVPLPANPIERQAIAQILSDIDKDFESLETKLEKYKMIKQGMMQELLTGKKRLI